MKIIVTIALLIFPCFSHAQAVDTLNLGEVVVTASKMPVLEKETTKPVTIIDAKEIQRSAGKNLAELLDAQNGILINGSHSSPGKDKSVYLRGASTQYTLILIDGFPVSDPSSEGGAFDLRLIPLSNVDRIEIVKGSMSTLYGSDAIAGVINIITKKPENGLVNVKSQVSYGSFNTFDLLVGANGSAKKISYAVDASLQQTDGISEAQAPAGQQFQKDGYTRNAISAKLNFKPVGQIEIIPFLNFSDYEGDYDGGPFSDADNQFLAAFLNTGSRFQVSLDEVDLKGAYTFTKTERTFIDQFGNFSPESKTHNADVFAMYNRFEHMRILAGLNYQNMAFNIEDEGINNSIELVSPYLTSYLKTNFGLNTELGIRFNHHSLYGTNWTYNIAPVFSINDNVRILASLSSGFKAPTLNELFGTFGANLNLQPQKSRTLDTGIEINFGNTGLSADVHYFKRHIDNLISYENSGYVNINQQNDYGIEISSSYVFKSTNITAYYNYLDGAITENGIETNNLIRRPNHNFGFKINQAVTDRLSANLQLNYIGKRTDIFYNPASGSTEEVELDEYFLADLYAQYKLIKNNLLLFIDVKNLLDTTFAEVYGFNTPGIHYRGGIRYRF